jgi:hypothetical protein
MTLVYYCGVGVLIGLFEEKYLTFTLQVSYQVGKFSYLGRIGANRPMALKVIGSEYR